MRRAIGDRQTNPPHLWISPTSLQFNAASDHWLDVRAFQELLQGDDASVSLLKQALTLYRGVFVEGLAPKGCPAFNDWVLIVRERLQQLASAALTRLVAHYERQGDLDQACDTARRQVVLEPWREEAHRTVMRLLALSGQRSEALAQYEACCRAMRQELDVVPTDATTRLYQQIRDGAFQPPTPVARLTGLRVACPPFLRGGPETVATPLFVARERELAELEAHLDRALAGQGRVVCVTGEAGKGKSALIDAFACQAQRDHPDLVVAGGFCNGYTGLGDPYLPFRELLELLTGDVEDRYTAGAMQREHARRLWQGLPWTAQALLAHGPDLIGSFVHGGALAERAALCALPGEPWLDQLEALVGQKTTGPGPPAGGQEDLFTQYAAVLQELARQAPLLLVVDDLQWADLGSISLLFHLGRGLAHAGGRILILGAYRPEEIALGRPAPESGGWERHPLEPLVHEFRRAWGEIEIPLDRAEGRGLVDALVDSQSNQLGRGFRRTLYQQTRGHPLFTIELLRGMQERGDLVPDADGAWAEGPLLDWKVLPARVEAVIAARMGRLAGPLLATLRVASVEGEFFTAEVAARAGAIDERAIVAALSGELDRKHRLVRAQGLQRTTGQRLSRYRFRHILFQKYLYNGLDPVERAHLHEKVGVALETLHGNDGAETSVIAPQLAWHFESAGMPGEAATYYQVAGDRAVRMSANQEAIAHFNRGIALLQTLPDTPERARRELALQLALTVPVLTLRSWGAPEAARAYARARELCDKIDDRSQLLLALFGERASRTVRGEHRVALELAEQGYSLTQHSGDPLHALLGHQELVVALMFVGELAGSLAHVEGLMARYDPQSHAALAFQYGQDPAVLALSFAVYDLFYLGYPDQALQSAQQGLALAQEIDHPFTWVWALAFKGRLHRWRREVQAVHEIAEGQLRLWTEHGLELAEAEGAMNAAWVAFQKEPHEKRVAQYRQGLARLQGTGVGMHLPEWLGVLAEMYGEVGQPGNGLKTLDEALDIVRETGEVYYEAELHRLKGELLLMLDEGGGPDAEASPDRAAACFQQAIAVARCQSAKMSELRASVSLARLWREQGQREPAREMLAGIYGWFSEGFDTRDLCAARALLEALAHDQIT